MFGRVFGVLISIASIRVYTTLLSSTEVGRLNILSAISGWFWLVLISPVSMYVGLKIINWAREGLAYKYLFSFLKYLFIIAGFAIVSVAAIKYSIGIGIDIKISWLSVLISGSILLTIGSMIFVSCLNFLGHRLWYVILTSLTLGISLAISAFLVSKIGGKAEYWMSGQLLGQFLILMVTFAILFRVLRQLPVVIKSGDNDRSFTFPVVFQFAWPVAIGIILYWIHTQGYRFAFQKVAGIETLGLFAVGFGIGSNLMVSFDGLFNQYYQPIFYNEIANSTEEQRTIAWNKYAHAFFPAIVLVMLYIAANGSLIAKIFTGEKFHQVGNIILWGALSEGLRMMASTTTMVAHAQFETKPLILPSITGAASAITGIFLFARNYPFIGSGVSLTIGWLLSLIHLYSRMKNILPIQMPWRRIFYSLILGIPLGVVFVVRDSTLFALTIFQSLVILCISGLYLLFAQYILARKWVSLPIKVPLIDNLEQKLKLYFYREI